MTQPQVLSDGKSFWGSSSGRWAGEQFLRAMASGKEFSPAALRTADTLRKDEWIAFDEALVEEGMIRLRGIADLMAAGLTRPVANAMGKTVLQWESIGTMQPAQVSMDGMTRTEMDRLEFELNNLPLPIIHKDWYLNLRSLAASRDRGESLDVTNARVAGRVVAEKLENILFNGHDKTFGGMPIYGYTTHPDRNQLDFGPDGAWDDADVSGEDMLSDVLRMVQAANDDRFFGPFWLYVPAAYSVRLESDFKANGDKSIRVRLAEIDQLVQIRTVDQLATGNIVLVQASPDVVVLVDGEPIQTVQWDIEGGFNINFKAFTIQVPLIRSDPEGRSGVVHMHTP